MIDSDDIQKAFDATRREVAGPGARPSAQEIIRQGRTRRRARLAATGATVALAVAALTMAQIAGRPGHEVVTPTSPTPSVREPTSPPSPIHVRDLIYDPASHADPRHWTRDKLPAPSTGELVPNTPACGFDDRDKGPDLAKDASGFELTYAPGLQRADAADLRGEQVMRFTTAANAHRMMAQILANARLCGATVTIARPAIGDEALGLSHTYLPKSAVTRTTEEAVAVRVGRAVAIYWDVHQAGTSPTATLGGHEQDARTMAARLCHLGEGC